MAKPVIYEPRPGIAYSATYTVRNGMAYVEAQGRKGVPVKIDGLPEIEAARYALQGMVGKFKLTPDA